MTKYMLYAIVIIAATILVGILLYAFSMPNNKVVVFDLDGTLGDFGNIATMWFSLQNFHKGKLPNSAFFELMDIFPEFLRPNIFAILNYLKLKKLDRKLKKVFIYTNNQGPKSWAVLIKDYFNNRLSYNLFDGVVGAFKVAGKIVEPCRTSNAKRYDDLIKCTKLSKKTQICFIDDQYHEEMINERVYYIYIEPYLFTMPLNELVRRYLSHETTFDRSTLHALTTNESSLDRTYVTQDDKLVSKRLMGYLQRFLRASYGTIKHKVSRKSSRFRTQRRKLADDSLFDF